MKCILNKFKIIIFLAVLVIGIFIYTIFISFHAKEIGEKVGKMKGIVVGTALGSAKGVTEGVKQGVQSGIEEGLSAKDTKVDFKETMQSMERLEVLVVGVTLQNFHEVGDEYKALYLVKGDAVFSVDLKDAAVRYSADQTEIFVSIPKPTLDLYINQGGTEKLAESQKFSFSVSAKDGFEAYLNSMAKTVEGVKETMGNYEELEKMAEDSTVKQVEQLAQTIFGKEKKVHIEFK